MAEPSLNFTPLAQLQTHLRGVVERDQRLVHSRVDSVAQGAVLRVDIHGLDVAGPLEWLGRYRGGHHVRQGYRQQGRIAAKNIETQGHTDLQVAVATQCALPTLFCRYGNPLGGVPRRE